jgi:hypothetical protein
MNRLFGLGPFKYWSPGVLEWSGAMVGYDRGPYNPKYNEANSIRGCKLVDTPVIEMAHDCLPEQLQLCSEPTVFASLVCSHLHSFNFLC